MIQPVNEDEANAKRLNRKVERTGDDLISEVVQEANKFYMERLAGRDQCAVTTRQTLRNIRDKVDGLSFLNSALTLWSSCSTKPSGDTSNMPMAETSLRLSFIRSWPQC